MIHCTTLEYGTSDGLSTFRWSPLPVKNAFNFLTLSDCESHTVVLVRQPAKRRASSSVLACASSEHIANSVGSIGWKCLLCTWDFKHRKSSSNMIGHGAQLPDDQIYLATTKYMFLEFGSKIEMVPRKNYSCSYKRDGHV